MHCFACWCIKCYRNQTKPILHVVFKCVYVNICLCNSTCTFVNRTFCYLGMTEIVFTGIHIVCLQNQNDVMILMEFSKPCRRRFKFKWIKFGISLFLDFLRQKQTLNFISDSKGWAGVIIFYLDTFPQSRLNQENLLSLFWLPRTFGTHKSARENSQAKQRESSQPLR